MDKTFNVIVERNNTFVPYNVIPHLLYRYNMSSKKLRPTTYEEVKKFIIEESKYQWWARCEYEIILSSWPTKKVEEKWDVHKQVMMNIDIITKIIMDSINT